MSVRRALLRSGSRWTGRDLGSRRRQHMTVSGDFDLNPQLVAEAGSYRGVGADLRALRERQGHVIEEVAQSLRISARFLRAIEEGDFGSLPGPAYVVGFLRTYSDYLGTDPKAIVDQFRSEMSGFDAKPDLEFPKPPEETSVPTTPIIVGSVSVAALVFGIWLFMGGDERVGFDPVPPVPDGFGESESGKMADQSIETGGALSEETDVVSSVDTVMDGGGPSASIATETVDVSAEAEIAPSAPVESTELTERTVLYENEEAQNSSESSGLDGDAQVPLLAEGPLGDDNLAGGPGSENAEAITGNRAPAPAEPTLIPTPPPPPTSIVDQSKPQVYGLENTDSRVTLMARQDSWVQVQNAENELLITRILYSGDSYKVPDRPGLSLITGNAGGLEVLIDGEATAPLGPEGAVRRNIPLEPEALLSLSRRETR